MRAFFHKRLFPLLVAFLLLSGCMGLAYAAKHAIEVYEAQYPVVEGGSYNTLEEVAVYLAEYGVLPSNFLTKKEAQALGWSSREGNLDDVAAGFSIGGDHFGNYEENPTLPQGKSWTECDLYYAGGYRNGYRLVFSKDGLIYYSDDHYDTFTQVLVIPGEGGGQEAAASTDALTLEADGWYTAKEEVAAYLHQYGQLPENYLTKSEAKALGWTNKKNNLGEVAPGCAIGGDSFGNREGLLPDAKGRHWMECDVNTQDGKRGKERIVYSNDGLIYYTPDSHKTFQQLY